MADIEPLDLFPGIATLVAADPLIFWGRIGLIALGFVLIYLGRKGVLEALLMIPMGLGMATVNAAVMFLDDGRVGTLFVDPLVSGTEATLQALQINWLQPVYTLMFSNGLIAVLVFMGIGVLLDVGYVMARPFQSMLLAVFAELGTVATYPLAVALGMTQPQAASVAMIGSADGPMVLFASLMLAKDLFVPITVVGYLYLGLTYGAYPYLIKLLIPERLRAIPMPVETGRPISAGQKLVFAVAACTLLSLLFPVASPLFLALFAGVVVRESGLVEFQKVLAGPVLYTATFFLALSLGILCEASTILSPVVLKLLLLGIVALTLSALGGILGGYVLWAWTGGRYNPMIGVAGVSCIPTTAKIVQKLATAANPGNILLPHALGASISGVITSAILTGIYVAALR